MALPFSTLPPQETLPREESGPRFKDELFAWISNLVLLAGGSGPVYRDPALDTIIV